MILMPGTFPREVAVKYQTQSLQSLLHEAANTSRISETILAALDLLFELSNTPELASNPLLHATTHTLIALNIPLYYRRSVDDPALGAETRTQRVPLQDSSGVFWKSVYLTKADDILSDLVRDRHANGNCEVCAQYTKSNDLQSKTGSHNSKTDLKEDGSECNCVVRLQKILEKERAIVYEEISQCWSGTMKTELHHSGKGGQALLSEMGFKKTPRGRRHQLRARTRNAHRRRMTSLDHSRSQMEQRELCIILEDDSTWADELNIIYLA